MKTMKWNPTQRKLIRQSIAHWRRLATGKLKEDEDVSSYYCPLCETYLSVQCCGCPIKAKTGLIWCRKTPYKAAFYSACTFGLHSDEFRKDAKKELKFLENLLKEGL